MKITKVNDLNTFNNQHNVQAKKIFESDKTNIRPV